MVKTEEQAKIASLFTYFWLTILDHFKATAVVFVSNV